MPDEMHRTLHAVASDERNRNFGFLRSVWDRVSGMHRATARDDPASMPIGLADFRGDETQHYRALMLQPFSSR